MKVIEGHFNPLRRPDRIIYSCRLTEKVQLDSDERKKKRGEDRENKTAEAGVVSLSQSYLDMQHLERERYKCDKAWSQTLMQTFGTTIIK